MDGKMVARHQGQRKPRAKEPRKQTATVATNNRQQGDADACLPQMGADDKSSQELADRVQIEELAARFGRARGSNGASNCGNDPTDRKNQSPYNENNGVQPLTQAQEALLKEILASQKAAREAAAKAIPETPPSGWQLRVKKISPPTQTP